jgi:drug/metabolite transporter (DMT)-like permease
MAGLGLDLCAKQLLQSYSLEQFVFLRSIIGVGLFLSISRHFGGLQSLRTHNFHWHAFRTLLSTGAMFGFFYGLTQMPLIEALTLGFTAPLMVTALAAVFLDEHVGWRRWFAVALGFSGVVIMLRPGSGEITLASAAVLLAAFCYASLAITSRKLGAEESSLSLSLYVITGPALLSSYLMSQSGWTTPDGGGWVLFGLAGACSVIAWIGIVGGYRRASPAMLAPFEYSALVLGAIAGYVIWDEIPDRYTVIGATIIVGSGLFVAYRELGSPLANRYIRALTASALKPRRK